MFGGGQWRFGRAISGCICVSLLSSACTVTPSELRSEGERLLFFAAQRPLEVAWCMGRVVEERDSMWHPSVRPLGGGASYELLIQVIAGDSTTVLAAEMSEVSDGSRIDLWLTRQHLYGGRSKFLAALVAGCALRKGGV